MRDRSRDSVAARSAISTGRPAAAGDHCSATDRNVSDVRWRRLSRPVDPCAITSRMTIDRIVDMQWSRVSSPSPNSAMRPSLSAWRMKRFGPYELCGIAGAINRSRPQDRQRVPLPRSPTSTLARRCIDAVEVGRNAAASPPRSSRRKGVDRIGTGIDEMRDVDRAAWPRRPPGTWRDCASASPELRPLSGVSADRNTTASRGRSRSASRAQRRGVRQIDLARASPMVSIRRRRRRAGKAAAEKAACSEHDHPVGHRGRL